MVRKRYANHPKRTIGEVVYEQRTIIFALAVVILGLIFLFVPGLPSKFRILAIALIPAGIITAITEFYLRKDFIREFREARYRYDLIDELERLGIKNIFENRRREDPIFGYMAAAAETAPHTIKKLQLLGLTLEPFMHIVGDYTDDLLRGGCEFQFLTLDANGAVAERRMKDQGQPGLLDRIRSFDIWLNEQMSKPNSAGKIEARKYDLMPTVHITIINEEKIFVNPYPVLGATWDFPVLEIDKGGALFDKYRRQFEEVWHKAYPIR
ncbi:hypothetical protein M1N21_01730 [Dehalococcoidia bacterium]|nr:hypothetical protein [Dehalococcoidia bacterium]